jgi:ATP-dependent protease ClpP protease subunit
MTDAHEKENIEDFDSDDEAPVVIKKIPVAGKNYIHIYLSNNIETAETYRDLRHVLRTTASTDVVTFYLSGYGGDCHGLISIVSAINASKAKVHMAVDAPCYSAHATLALAGDSLSMNKRTFLMFHNYSGGHYGKGNELTSLIQHTNKWIHGYFKEYHCPFLTEEECEKIIKDKDIYVHAEDKDIKTRIRRHFKRSKK